MRNPLSVALSPIGGAVGVPAPSSRRSLANLLSPLDQVVAGSPNFVVDREAKFERGGETYVLPRYLFIGPKSGDAPIRIGIFAVIHGDEPEGGYALVRFLQFLERYPEAAAGYCLSVYPVCNPTGFEDNTRHPRNGRDLDGEFWRKSNEPEAGLLKAELAAHLYHGIISLHTDATSEGFYGFASGPTLTKELLVPALQAAEKFLPLDGRPRLEIFAANRAIIQPTPEDALIKPARTRPFEIALNAPKHQPTFLTEAAFGAALQTILLEYRNFIAYARNL
jgi:murein peptide amidase A